MAKRNRGRGPKPGFGPNWAEIVQAIVAAAALILGLWKG